jgi:hypothetical protein
VRLHDDVSVCLDVADRLAADLCRLTGEQIWVVNDVAYLKCPQRVGLELG